MNRRFVLLISLLLIALPLVAVDKQLAGSATVTAPGGAGLLPTDFQPRPIPMGVSVSNTPSLPFIYAGTAGLRVRAFGNPNLKFILSNNHVLGSKGPTLCPDTATLGTRTLQPGTLDIGDDPGNDPTYVAGIFIKAVKLITGATARNLVDAAVSITTPAFAKTEIFNIGVPTVGYVAPTVGMPVIKSGRTTGVTNGTVNAVNMTVNVNYGSGCNVYRFVRQVEITPNTFSAGGDSGSAILDAATNTPVALLFAGSSTSTVGNDIANVYRSLGVFVDSDSAGASEEEITTMLKNTPEDPEQARLEAIQSRNEDRILTMPNVVAIGIGREGSRYVFRVYVSKMTPAARTAVPQAIEGVPVEIIESGEFRAL